MVKVVILSAAAAAIAAWLLRWHRRTGGGDEMGRVVLQAYEGEWTSRFGVSGADLRDAVTHGRDKPLLERIDEEVGVIGLRFDTAGRGMVDAKVDVSYRDRVRSSATLALAWDDVPGDVRAALIRDRDATVFRKWRAVA